MKEEYVTVAVFTPDHRSAEAHRRSEAELDRILSGNGIEFGLDGSRTYKVIVSNTQADKARDLLKSARLKWGEVKILKIGS
jgi:hypothetical protein